MEKEFPVKLAGNPGNSGQSQSRAGERPSFTTEITEDTEGGGEIQRKSEPQSHGGTEELGREAAVGLVSQGLKIFRRVLLGAPSGFGWSKRVDQWSTRDVGTVTLRGGW